MDQQGGARDTPIADGRPRAVVPGAVVPGSPLSVSPLPTSPSGTNLRALMDHAAGTSLPDNQQDNQQDALAIGAMSNLAVSEDNDVSEEDVSLDENTTVAESYCLAVQIKDPSADGKYLVLHTPIIGCTHVKNGLSVGDCVVLLTGNNKVIPSHRVEKTEPGWLMGPKCTTFDLVPMKASLAFLLQVDKPVLQIQSAGNKLLLLCEAILYCFTYKGNNDVSDMKSIPHPFYVDYGEECGGRSPFAEPTVTAALLLDGTICGVCRDLGDPNKRAKLTTLTLSDNGSAPRTVFIPHQEQLTSINILVNFFVQLSYNYCSTIVQLVVFSRYPTIVT